MVQDSAPRSPRGGSERHDERRRALAESALQTLGELGYARSSLREIANNSEFSHGVVHYYFHDKLELIMYCVAYFKEARISRYDEDLAHITDADEFAREFAAKLVETIVEEAAMQRLWYDLRAQAMFEPTLRESVRQIDSTLEQMVFRVFQRYAELLGTDLTLPPSILYGSLDGMFQQALLGHLCGDEHALEEFQGMIELVVPFIVK